MDKDHKKSINNLIDLIRTKSGIRRWEIASEKMGTVREFSQMNKRIYDAKRFA